MIATERLLLRPPRLEDAAVWDPSGEGVLRGLPGLVHALDAGTRERA